MQYSSIYAFEKSTFITRKQIVSVHPINQSIDKNTYLSNILIIYFSDSTDLQHFLHSCNWYKENRRIRYEVCRNRRLENV